MHTFPELPLLAHYLLVRRGKRAADKAAAAARLAAADKAAALNGSKSY